MSENKHTPEPWEWSKHRFNSPPFEGTLEKECGIYPPLGESGPVAIASGEANARRIVACVNACAGLANEQLDRVVKNPLSSYRELMQQRDELLAALEKCRKELSAWMRDHGDDIATQEAVADARAAIAKAKGNHTEQPLEMVESSAPAIVFYPAGSLGEEVQP